MAIWNLRAKRGRRVTFFPTIGTALAANTPILEVLCPACQTVGEVDIRKRSAPRRVAVVVDPVAVVPDVLPKSAVCKTDWFAPSGAPMVTTSKMQPRWGLRGCKTLQLLPRGHRSRNSCNHELRAASNNPVQSLRRQPIDQKVAILYSRYVPRLREFRRGLEQAKASRIEPGLPSLARKPPSGAGWLHEIKHDGFRMMVQRDAAGVRIITRNGHDWTSRYPLIATAAKAIKAKSSAPCNCLRCVAPMLEGILIPLRRARRHSAVHPASAILHRRRLARDPASCPCSASVDCGRNSIRNRTPALGCTFPNAMQRQGAGYEKVDEVGCGELRIVSQWAGVCACVHRISRRHDRELRPQ